PYQFVLLYTVGWDRIAAAAAAVNQAIEDGSLQVGEQVGLPLHRFALEDTAAAHSAVENGVTGKVLIAVAPAGASEREAWTEGARRCERTSENYPQKGLQM